MTTERSGKQTDAPGLFHAGTALVATILFLICWRAGYAMHFFGWRPLWRFIETFRLLLGWLGLSAIVLSMIYSARRLNWISWGSLRFWMKVHVWLGLIGPALIEIHGYGKNYGVAGWSDLLMWLVALSGFVGLYLRSFLAEDLKLRRDQIADLQGHIQDLNFRLAEHRVRLLEVQEQIADVGKRTQVADHERKAQRGELARNPRALLRVGRDYLAYLSEARALRRRFRRSLDDERRATRLVARHTRLTLDLEIRSRTSGFMNELLVLWRLVHVPLTMAFVMTCLVHLWAIWRY